jgi:Tfp pilus assembly PilM family ATPase
MSKNFFDFFPPLKFLEMPSVGFSISDTSLRFVELRDHEGTFVLGDYSQRVIPIGAIDAGYINKPEQVIEALGDLKKKYDLKFIKATLPEEKAFVFRTQIPTIVREEMRNAVEFTIEENVPMSVSDVEFDFTIVPCAEVSSEHTDVAVCVVPKKVIEAYMAIFNEVGLTVTAFELESQAIARSVVDTEDKASYLILNLEKNKTGFYIATAGAVHFTSTMSINADDLPELTEEISKIYWHAHGEKKEKGGTKIVKIILCGEGATKNGVKEFIFNKLGIEVEVANVWKNVFVLDKYVPDISLNDSLGFAAAIGLALPDGSVSVNKKTS